MTDLANSRRRGRAGLASLSWPGPILGSALLALALTLLWTLSEAKRPFYYDSLNYWALGSSFTVRGHFSLLNFHDDLRGYLFPLVAHVLSITAKWLSLSNSVVVRIFNAAIVVAIGTQLLPMLAELAWPQHRWGTWRRVLLTMVVMIMWSGFLLFPLTDLPSVALALLALVASSANRARNPWWMLVAGFATGAALDLRPAYVLLVPLVAILVALAWWQAFRAGRAERWRRLACAVLALVAFGLVSLPQALVMHKQFDSWSIVPGSHAGLTALQYTGGTQLQLYDTYVGQGYPPQMNFLDPGGVKLLATLPDGRIGSLSQLVRVTVEHPIVMGTLFVRHVVNGLDQRYASPYISHLRVSDWWRRIAGFGLVLIALIRLLWPPARRTLGSIRWRYPVALVVCGATAIASAVETRFMLPVVVLSYTIVLTPGWRTLAASLSPAGVAGLSRRDAISGVAVLLLAIALIVLVVVVTHATSQHLSFP